MLTAHWSIYVIKIKKVQYLLNIFSMNFLYTIFFYTEKKLSELFYLYEYWKHVFY